MSFIQNIREYICKHNEDRFEKRERSSLYCLDCNTILFDVYDFLTSTKFPNPFMSIDIAYSYAQWTGDIHTPCIFTLTQVPGIMPRRIQISVMNIVNTIHLLQLLNGPFEENWENKNVPEGLFRNFMEEYLKLIDRMASSDETVRVILYNMQNAFSHVDLFKHYFEVLTPYVQSVGPQQSLFQKDPQEENFSAHSMGLKLYYTLQRAINIRSRYSPYCVSFDVIHVMVLCYLCGQNTDAVANLVFHLGAQLCKGYFSSMSVSLQTKVNHILKTKIKLTTHARLYYLVEAIRRGEAVDLISEEFIKKFHELDKTIMSHLKIKNEIETFTYRQVFPYILFPNDADYFGFVMAIAHYTTKSNEKKIVSQSKQLYRFTNRLVQSIRAFDPEGHLPWNKDTFELFLCSDANLEKELAEVMQMLMVH